MISLNKGVREAGAGAAQVYPAECRSACRPGAAERSREGNFESWMTRWRVLRVMGSTAVLCVCWVERYACALGHRPFADAAYATLRSDNPELFNLF
jgi:hypothetical protein